MSRTKRLSTLEKLAEYYSTNVKLSSKTNRKYVEILKEKTYYVIDNHCTDASTLLITGLADNQPYLKVKNNNWSFDVIRDAIDLNKSCNRVELFGELYDIT